MSMASSFLFLAILCASSCFEFAFSVHDYADALSKSILFYEAQRSGYLPPNQRITWRSHSGLNDGKSSGIDLVGGYYDAGDNVKFGLPMAFTITMMSWSVIEYRTQLQTKGQLGHALAAIKWGTDYFIKAHPQPYVLYGEVGDGNTDHRCWQRPEDMTTDRTAYKIDSSHPGSDLAGETAAAMAAASIVFRHYDPAYSAELLTHARQLFTFADKFRGKYDSSIPVAKPFYQSFSGFYDELLWAAAWMYKATHEQFFLNYLSVNADSMGGTTTSMTEFSWDAKYVGVQVLVSKILMDGNAGQYAPVFARYQQKAEFYMCSCLGKASTNVQRTSGGLLFNQGWNNMHFVTTASFLLIVYSDYLTLARKQMSCATPSDLFNLAKSQVDYILGDNPRTSSYMVGYGRNYPQQVHHRGASIVSIKSYPKLVTCQDGYATWFNRKASNPNILIGAIVGGPDAHDQFIDQRFEYQQTEPTTYNNAPLIGVLARLCGGYGHYNHLSEDSMNDVSPATTQPNLQPPSKSLIAPNHKDTKDSAVVVQHKVTSSWKDNGKSYYRYSATVTNKSSKTLKDLKMTINELYGPVWGVTESGGSYTFPSWIKSLAAGESFEFIYIHASPAADVSVSSYTLA